MNAARPFSPLPAARHWLMLAAGVLLGHLLLIQGLADGGFGLSEPAPSPTMLVRQVVVVAPQNSAAKAPESAGPQPAERRPRASASASPRPVAESVLSQASATVAAPSSTPPAPAEAAVAVEAAASQPEIAGPPPLSAAASVAQAAADATPVYATAMPAPAELAYELRRGLLTGSGVLRWQPDGDRYTLQLQGAVMGLPVIEQHSRGQLDAYGLAPERFADQRRGRDRRATNFQREAGKITFSASTAEVALAPGAQDRLSWMVQLTAIAAAQPLRPGRQLSMQVAGLRGDVDWWVFSVQPDDGSGMIHLVREARRPYDTRVEVWLDPAQGHWPARAVQSTQDSDARFELRRRDLEIAEPIRN